MTSRAAGLIYGHDLHYLDHLAPLCCVLGIPLLVTEEKIAQFASKYYQGLEVIHLDYLAAAEHLVSHHNVIFYSMPRDLFDEICFIAQKLRQKRIHTVWCPHGNSDKGGNTYHMEGLRKEEVCLVYGKQMIETLKSARIYDNLKAHVITGNYRYQFYLERKAFYDQIAEREIKRRLPPAEKTLLYAPTWQDYEKSTSFYDATPPLIETLPEKTNLIIKLHPNLHLQDEFRAESLIETYRNHPHVLFLTDFPPIYPLLNLADAYIGDMSSVGYDYLAFNRPLFFLNQNGRSEEDLYLFRSGIAIHKGDYASIHKKIQEYFLYELRDFSNLRKEIYALAFGPEKPLSQLKEEIARALRVFPESDLSFF
ncbi:MAG: CDP-glycerol glycerophosphotransferase family protein [Verrucomicrobia bacterium]|nr:CDP-glycerol glycerophosphotransferase family protein [Verrucomicrobiota bacterium]